MNSIEFIERLKKVAEVKEDQALAEIFGMSKASFSYAKKNNSFSASMLFDFSQKYNCDLHWLITGKEANASRDTAESMLLAGFKELTDKQKMQAVTFVGNLTNGITASTPSQSIGGNGVNVAGGIRIEK